MLESNDSTRPAVAVAAAAAESLAATKRSHNEMETSTPNKDASTNTKIDNIALFAIASGREKIILAKKRTCIGTEACRACTATHGRYTATNS